MATIKGKTLYLMIGSNGCGKSRFNNNNNCSTWNTNKNKMEKELKNKIEQLIKNSGLIVEIPVNANSIEFLYNNSGCYSKFDVQLLIIKNYYRWFFRKNVFSFLLKTQIPPYDLAWFLNSILSKYSLGSQEYFEVKKIYNKLEDILGFCAYNCIFDHYGSIENLEKIKFINNCLIKYCIKTA